MKRKFLTLFAAVCLILAIGSTGALAADQIFVNNKDILTAEDYTVPCGDGKAVCVYNEDDDTYTLTLTDAEITTPSGQAYMMQLYQMG